MCAMATRQETLDAVRAALPVMVGYVSIGLPCGIMEQQAGPDVVQALMLSCLLYSGAGQFMISGMWMAGSPVAAIVASVSAVSARQVLYGVSLSKYIDTVKKRLALLFALGVTDETFGVNVQRLELGSWTITQALLVNALCCASWTSANVMGVLLGSVVSIPTAVGAFAMTSIFVCLLFSQKRNTLNIVVACTAVIGVILCKLVGLSNPAIVVGAVVGVVAGLAYLRGRGEVG